MEERERVSLRYLRQEPTCTCRSLEGKSKHTPGHIVGGHLIIADLLVLPRYTHTHTHCFRGLVVKGEPCGSVVQCLARGVKVVSLMQGHDSFLVRGAALSFTLAELYSL